MTLILEGDTWQPHWNEGEGNDWRTCNEHDEGILCTNPSSWKILIFWGGHTHAVGLCRECASVYSDGVKTYASYYARNSYGPMPYQIEEVVL